jgi:hypothetical protein
MENSRDSRRIRQRLPWTVVWTVILCALSCSPFAGQEPGEAQSPIDWYYAAAFGTGVYQINDRTVAVLRLPFSHRLRSLGEGQTLRLLLPVTLGFYDLGFDEIPDSEVTERLGTVSVLPGLELSLPMGPDWVLTPYAELGLGRAIEEDNHAVIYAVGVKSRVTLFSGAFDFMLGNAFTYAGYDADDVGARSLSRFVTGFNFLVPLQRNLGNRPAELGVHLVHTHYFDALDFTLPQADDLQQLTDEVELAVTVGVDRPWSILGFPLRRIGLGVRVGDDLTGSRLVTGFPF